jgi:hypothetical protein
MKWNAYAADTSFWASIAPDADGHARWKLGLHAEDRSGRRRPQTVPCVATDKCCTRQEAAHPGKQAGTLRSNRSAMPALSKSLM